MERIKIMKRILVFATIVVVSSVLIFWNAEEPGSAVPAKRAFTVQAINPADVVHMKTDSQFRQQINRKRQRAERFYDRTDIKNIRENGRDR